MKSLEKVRSEASKQNHSTETDMTENTLRDQFAMAGNPKDHTVGWVPIALENCSRNVRL